MIRRARADDVPHIVHFIRELARYERLESELDLDPARVREHLFGNRPVAEALLAEDDGRPVGFALFYLAYSTFKSRPFLHLEDLFVLPEMRGRGHGLALLQWLAAEAVRRNCARLAWNVLDWNELAIRFYESHGAELLRDWRTCRLVGGPLQAMATAAETP